MWLDSGTPASEGTKPAAHGAFADRLSALLKSPKSQKWLLILGACGVLLIALSGVLPKKQETVKAAASFSADAYVTATEQKLKTLLSSIEGAGECQVMVTLQNGVEYRYANEQKTGSNRIEDSGSSTSRLTQKDDREQSAIVVDTGDGKTGLLVTEIQPTVQGVVVVCEGGDSAPVREAVMQAVMTALNVTQSRVCVTKLS